MNMCGKHGYSSPGGPCPECAKEIKVTIPVCSKCGFLAVVWYGRKCATCNQEAEVVFVEIEARRRD